MAKNASAPIVKLMLIGDSSVGKSCLIYRYVENTFSASFMATVGIDFKTKNVEIDGNQYKLQLWDTAGQDQFHTVTRSYYRGAEGILLVYDVTNSNSFDNINKWLTSIKQYSNNDAPIMIVGNKIDLKEKRTVPTFYGEEMRESFRNNSLYGFQETSAFSGENVEEAFISLAKMVIAKKNVNSEKNESHLTPNSNKNVSSCSCNL